MGNLDGRRIAVGVDGGPTAFESAELVRALVKAGATVQVVLTPRAERWIGRLTLETVSAAPAIRDAAGLSGLGAVDGVVVLPAGPALAVACALSAPHSADALAAGADPVARLLALRVPRVVVPGADLPPEAEAAFSGARVLGRGDSPAAAVAALERRLRPRDLAGRKVVVTAGPTREHIDPVRFISNPSSGKMGYALAEAALRRGAEVVLCTGPTQLAPPAGARVVGIETAEALRDAVDAEADTMDLFLAVAAVGDYRPAEVSREKIKKGEGELVLRLVRTPDVLGGIGERLGGQEGGPVLVGFAAETGDLEAYARRKLEGKRLDLVVANRVSGPDGAFGADENEVLLVHPDGADPVGRASKDEIADLVLDRAVPLLDARRPRG